MDIIDGSPRYFRITRAEHGIKPWTIGIYDGGPLRFARFLRPMRDEYFVSLRVIEADRDGLFIEVDGIGKALSPAHPDVARP